jgi:Concanavalin A-like lectin/glucanases superfamily
MKTNVIFLLSGLACWAQSYPVAAGWPSTYIRYNDKTGGLYARADTWHFTAYTAAGNRFGVYADGSVGGTNSCNAAVVKLAAFDVNSADNTNVQVWNDSSFCDNTLGYGTESNPSTAGNGCNSGTPCTNKPHDPFCVAGHCYLNIFRQQVGSPYSAYDSTLIRSDDLDSSPPHWCNSATIAANSGTCPANNTTKAGDPPNWATGSGVLFANQPKFSRLKPILPADYQDDGVHCPAIEGSNNYMYFLTESGDFLNAYALRVTCANLPSLRTSDWEAWTGSGWSSTLSNAASVMSLSTANPSLGGEGCGAGYWGLDGAGTSAAITYLPALGRYVMLGQFYDGCAGGREKSHLRLSQAASLTGPWTMGLASALSPDYYQYGTNPHGFALNGAIGSATTSITTNLAYDSLRDPPAPFVINIDSEKLLVTAASGTGWTVTRGYGGTTGVAHNSGAAILSPYHLHPGLVSFVAGSYRAVSGNHVTMDLAFEGDEYESASNGSKSDDVYGLYFLRLHFQPAVPQAGAQMFGNVPLRLSMGALGDKALPRQGLVRLFDFFDHKGNTLYPVLRPTDLIAGSTCLPSNNGGAALSSLFWNAAGLFFTNGSGLLPRCTTTDTWPITGNKAFTVTFVVNPTSATGSSQTIGHVAYYGNNSSGGLSFGLDSAGGTFLFYDNGHGVGTAANKITAGSYNVITMTKTAGTTTVAGTDIYVNGALVCGADSATACTVYGGAITPNTQAQPVIFGIYGNGSGDCSASGTACNYQLSFTGTLATWAVWNRALSPAEVKRGCQEMARAYARPPRSITLTCN